MTTSCYFVVSPDFGPSGRDRLKDLNANQEFIFCKFGITQNGDLDEVRKGYTTHNPSFRFIKFQYNENIAGLVVNLGRDGSRAMITCTKDLGKVLEKVLALKGFTRVGQTEWRNSGSVEMVKNICDFLLKREHERPNQVLDKSNVAGFLRNIYKCDFVAMETD
jgi:hypothetical protein